MEQDQQRKMEQDAGGEQHGSDGDRCGSAAEAQTRPRRRARQDRAAPARRKDLRRSGIGQRRMTGESATGVRCRDQRDKRHVKRQPDEPTGDEHTMPCWSKCGQTNLALARFKLWS